MKAYVTLIAQSLIVLSAVVAIATFVHAKLLDANLGGGIIAGLVLACCTGGVGVAGQPALTAASVAAEIKNILPALAQALMAHKTTLTTTTPDGSVTASTTESATPKA